MSERFVLIGVGMLRFCVMIWGHFMMDDLFGFGGLCGRARL
jgi:hypothetical protein